MESNQPPTSVHVAVGGPLTLRAPSTVGWELTGKSIVVAIGEFIVDKHRHGTVFILQTLLHDGDLRLGDFQAGPAIPLEGGGFGQATQATDQSTGGHGKVITAILGALDGDGQTVGD